MFTPPTPILLPIPHFMQQSDADCLAACTLMVLSYLGHSVRYRQVIRLLGTQEHGTPFSNLHSLARLGVTVTVRPGNFSQLHDALAQKLPCIASVQTAELPHWNRRSEHAVVIAGIDSQYIFVNDPAFDIAPILVPHGDFDLAWLAQEELYAVVKA
jgi:ABC-type bacteriocin/lantibiotic exporter with double-glycine peptidase domain